MTYQPINWLEKIKFSQIGTNPEEPWHSWDHTSRDLGRVDYGIFSFSFEFRTLKLFHTRMETCIIHYPHSLKILNWHFSWTPCRSNNFFFAIHPINQPMRAKDLLHQTYISQVWRMTWNLCQQTFCATHLIQA